MPSEDDKTTGPGTLLRLLLTAALMLLMVRWMRGDELVDVEPATALEGRITRCDVNRQHYNWYLNDAPVRYNLWDFTPADPATDRLIRAAEARFDTTYGYNFYPTLAYYLRTGASLRYQL
jgi:hypothetical protein